MKLYLKNKVMMNKNKIKELNKLKEIKKNLNNL